MDLKIESMIVTGSSNRRGKTAQEFVEERIG